MLCRSAQFNPAAILVLVFTTYFAILEAFGGLTWGAFVGVPVWLTATWLYQHVAYAWAWALGVHILSWFLQVT